LRCGPLDRVIEKAEDFRLQDVRQWFDELPPSQNFQQFRRRCASGEQQLQLR
jgi:hypothetical protein